MDRARLFLGITLLLVPGCADRPRDAATAERAVAVTNEFMNHKLPQVDLDEMLVNTDDLGSKWRVSYDYPGGSTGGPAVFLVEKATGKILDVKMGQ